MRIVAYNIRHGQGVGGLISLRRTARVVGSLDADVVALNEVYRWPPRFDQPAQLGELLEMEWLFQDNVTHGPARYGNAILSLRPLRLHADLKLPKRREARGCLVSEIEEAGTRVLFATAHLALDRATRATQIEVLARELPRDRPLVLAGDLNCRADELGPLRAFLALPEDEPKTYHSAWPFVAYDHVMFSEHWTLTRIEAARSLASDHLPLHAELELR